MDTVPFFNHYGSSVIQFLGIMLLQSSILILILIALTRLLRRRVKAVFLYGLWMILLVKLILPVGLALPSSPAYWARGLLPDIKLNYESQNPEVLVNTDQEIASSDNSALPQLAFPADTGLTHAEQINPIAAAPPSKHIDASKTATLQQLPPSMTWQALTTLGWLVTVGVMMGLLLQRAFFVHTLIRRSKPANKAMMSRLKRCASKINARRDIDLRISPLPTSPSICGLIRPIILIPDSLSKQLNDAQIDAILLHELAHIKRGDLWVSHLQTLLQIVYFYNPLLWIANSIIRRIREQAVDERVLVAMEEHARDYPELLLSVSKLVWSKPMLSLRLIGVFESKYALSGRIRHILSRPFPKSARLGVAGIAAILISAAVLLPMAHAKSEIELETLGITVTHGEGENNAEKNIEFAGGTQVMQAFMEALYRGDDDALGTITSTANETTRRLRLSFNEIDKLSHLPENAIYGPSIRRKLTSQDPTRHARVGLFSGGRIKRINGVRYHLLAIIEQVDTHPWKLRDARWYHIDREIQEGGEQLNKRVAHAAFTLAQHLDPKKTASLSLTDIEEALNRLTGETLRVLGAGEKSPDPILHGNKVTLEKEDVTTVFASFMEALRSGQLASKELRLPPSLKHKLQRLSELCRLHSIQIEEIYSNASFAIAVTRGIQRHDGQPYQLGFTFIVYPHGEWVFRDTDWITPETQLAFVDGFKASYPNVQRVYSRTGLPARQIVVKNEDLFGIYDTLGVSDNSGALTIQSIHVAGLNGQALGSNNPRIVVDVINRSDEEIHLGLEYYTDYGSTLGGFYSPGASSQAMVSRVRPNWRGQLEFPMSYNRFAKGGFVDITLARCPGKRFDSASAEVLHKKQYGVMTVSQQKRAIKLLKILRTAKGHQRHDAAEALAKYGRNVVPAVTEEMLQEDNCWAAHALKLIGREAEDAVPALMASLAKGDDHGVRTFSASALGQIGPAAVQAIPALIETLQDKNWNTRQLAADALGFLSIGDAESTAALTASLRDEDERVRKTASRSLKRIKDKNSAGTVAHVH